METRVWHHPLTIRRCYLRGYIHTFTPFQDGMTLHRPQRIVNYAPSDAMTLRSMRAYTSSPTRPIEEAPRPEVAVASTEITPGNAIATITLSNPRKLNIVNISLLEALRDVCKDLHQHPSLRAVVLTGGPTAEGMAASFIGGADISEMHKLASPGAAKGFISKIHLACQALRDLPVPVIAKMDGFCLGAGLEIALACDLRVATQRSVFGMPEVRVGIPSVVEAALLPGLIGMGRTRRLLYLAENIDAVTAEEWGLVERVVEDEVQLSAAVNEWVTRMVEMGPAAMKRQKTLMQQWENCSVDDGIQAGVDAFALSFEDGGREPKEFMGRFVNRRR